MLPESHDYINILKFLYWTASLHFVLFSSEPLNLNTWHILAHIFHSLIAQSSVFHWMSDEEIVFVIPWQCLLSSHWSRLMWRGPLPTPLNKMGNENSTSELPVRGFLFGTYLAQHGSVIRLFWNASQAWTTTLCVPWMKLHLLFRAVMTFLVTSVCIPTQLTYCLWQAVLEITAHI